ncbi:protein-S-isoprenylcysteine O-methyltransferase [Pseudohyphozyma bogoriensis]|nr:protein-S-isoprenylcysteine O-methyltransferase [Pseudohyphozyma bogoriensis]
MSVEPTPPAPAPSSTPESKAPVSDKAAAEDATANTPSATPSAPLQGHFKVEWPLTSFASTPHNVASIAFCLGALCMLGATSASALVCGKHLVWSTSATTTADLPPQGLVEAIKSPVLGLYLSCWATFHLLEFLVTSMWNPAKLSVSSYLLDNGKPYHIAHAVGIIEHILEEAYLRPEWRLYKHNGSLVLFGFGLVVGGQILRSFAMYTAGSNFAHLVAYSKLPTHQLVTHGIYSWSRHPSYAGFTWWAVGTQVMLGNPFGVIAFSAVLYRFFSVRIKFEEQYLIKFFGDEYVKYRERVPTRILFIR